MKDEGALFLGWGTSADYSTDTYKVARLNAGVASGLRQFYRAHTWSFLKPTISLTLASGGTTVALPDNFGGFEGEITIPGGQNPIPLKLYPEGMIRAAFARTTAQTGRPQMASLRPISPVTTTMQEGQRFELYLYPTADAAYTLQFRYYIPGEMLTGTHPYAYGGAMHTETIYAAVKKALEETLDDEIGLWAQRYKEELAQSIDIDNRSRPQSLGYNRDCSDEGLGRYRPHYWNSPPVTYNGVVYD